MSHTSDNDSVRSAPSWASLGPLGGTPKAAGTKQGPQGPQGPHAQCALQYVALQCMVLAWSAGTAFARNALSQRGSGAVSLSAPPLPLLEPFVPGWPPAGRPDV